MKLSDLEGRVKKLFKRTLVASAISLSVLGVSKSASAETIGFDEYQVTTDLNDQVDADVTERYIFFRDFRNDNEDIFGFDMGPNGIFEKGLGDDGGIFPVATHSSVQRNPKGSKGYVVYETREFDSDGDIELAKIVNGSVVGTVRITNNSASQIRPYIWVDDNDNVKIVWQDNRNGTYWDANPDNDNWDIYKWESTTSWNVGDESQVTSNACDQLSPAVWFDETNTIISFADSRNYDCLFAGAYTNVFVKIDNNPEFEINSNFHPGACSPIDGELLVYHSYENGSYNIIVYNWKDMTETLFDKSGHQEFPDISNGIVVYTEGSDICGRFILNGEEFRVNSGDYPVVHKNGDLVNIVYDDYRSDYNIFLSRMYKLPTSGLVSLILLGAGLAGLGSRKLRDINKEIDMPY